MRRLWDLKHVRSCGAVFAVPTFNQSRIGVVIAVVMSAITTSIVKSVGEKPTSVVGDVKHDQLD
jgi:hypothetical protein